MISHRLTPACTQGIEKIQIFELMPEAVKALPTPPAAPKDTYLWANYFQLLCG